MQTRNVGGFYNPAIVTHNRVVGGAGTPGLTQTAGQSFSLAKDMVAIGIRLVIAKVASPVDTLNIDILTGSETGSVIASTTINVIQIPATDTIFDLFFTSPIALTASTTYYIRIQRSPDTEDVTNYCNIGGAGNGGIFTQGTFQYRFSNVWNADGGDDLYFGLLEGRNNLIKNANRYVSVGDGMSRNESAT